MANLVHSVCKECKQATGDEFCLECEIVLCAKCKVDHLKRKAFKKHHVDKTNYKLLGKKPSCFIHLKEVVFYCSSCSLLVCPSCMLEKHKQHDIEEIDAAVSAKKGYINSEIQDLETRYEHIQHIIDDANSFEIDYKKDNAIVIKLIAARGDALKSLIDKRIEEMKQMVQNEENVQITRKTDAVEILKEIELLFNSQITRLKSSLEITKDVDLLMSYVEWDEDIQRLKQREITEFEPLPPVRFLTPVNDEDKLAELFGKLAVGYRVVKTGDQIKIKPSVTEPINGWGDVTHDSIGIVKGVNNGTVTVDFPQFIGWEGLLSEIMVIESVGTEVTENKIE